MAEHRIFSDGTWRWVALALLVLVAARIVWLVIVEVRYNRRHPTPPPPLPRSSPVVLEQVMECPACSAATTRLPCKVCGGDGFVAVQPVGSST